MGNDFSEIVDIAASSDGAKRMVCELADTGAITRQDCESMIDQLNRGFLRDAEYEVLIRATAQN